MWISACTCMERALLQCGKKLQCLPLFVSMHTGHSGSGDLWHMFGDTARPLRYVHIMNEVCSVFMTGLPSVQMS